MNAKYQKYHKDEKGGNHYEEEFAKLGAHIEYLSHTEGISSSMLRELINK